MPEKVHLRGLDNLTTDDIKVFAAEYYKDHAPQYVQWINDTSANLVYESAEIAFEALRTFSAIEISEPSQIPALQTVTAKAFPDHPETHLEVRLAVGGDRKQAGARDRSRFYLLNPDYDPAERRRRGGERDRRGRSYRDRDDGGYRSQRFDDREHRKRQDEDAMDGFDGDLYDDSEAALQRRRERRDRRESSFSGSNDSRDRPDRRVRFRGAAGKELFPDKAGQTTRLRDRSASPSRGIAEDLEADRRYRRQQRDNAAAANRAKALAIKERLKEEGTKELFPHKLGVSHHRSLAFDAADATADLFAKQMPVPFVDGADGDSRSGSGAGFSIRGAAKAGVSYDFSIKGGAASVKELFPTRGADSNAGKELFGERLQGRGGRRQKAGDLFD